ncbi:ATP synthase protein [Geomicrobium sp. JCM 19037]|uniref:ATP synthase subunit I n=1 Tax=unclassified Geomicrobium TaxID=2628951 RepID=UPI00045F22BA|nr:ATP synthase subunit I [Geomicrobium sp. JCM 19037]GAK05689.1 ATP synthase protein [Geomicrobium sp. JCM 19037]
MHTQLQQRMKYYFRVVMIVAIVCLIGVFTTAYLASFLGFLLGIFSSMISFTSTYIKTEVVGAAASGESSNLFSYVVAGFSLLIRYGMIAVAVVVSLFNPESFALWAVLTGYGSLYLYIMVDMLLQLRKVR